MISRICKQIRNISLGYSINETNNVVNGLALTPSQMMSYSEQGIPIHSDISPDNFFDGDKSNVINLPISRVRGITATDIWQYQQDCRKNIRSSIDKSNQMFSTPKS